MILPASTIPEILIRQAERYGDRAYLFFHQEEVSFSRIAQQSLKVARGLMKAGLEKGERVAVLVYNSPLFFDFFFGIAAAGAILVPINTRYKAGEIQQILAHARPETLIVDEALWLEVENIRESCPSVKRIFVSGKELPSGTRPLKQLYLDENIPLPLLQPEDELAIIYTSGTTGRPKGVVLTHKNYLVNAFQGGKGKAFNEDTRVLTCLPLVHVNAQVSSFLSSFVMGGQLVVQKEFHPKDFLKALSAYQVTTFGGVPTVYAILLNQPDLEQYDLSHLTYCISGSSPMSPALLRKFEEVFHTNILEAYGLTEATALVSTNPPRGVRKIGSIGLPYEDVSMGVVDVSGHALGEDQIGEIVVSGESVMKGYYNDPEATSQVIINGWLHTGDLGYRDKDGYYFLSGRIKEIIIRGGVNIYPREIEEVLHTHAKISQVAVLGIPDPVWGERIHACVITTPGETISYEEMKIFLTDKLADYKIPAALSLHNQFPQIGPGKIQKNQLREEVLQREAH